MAGSWWPEQRPGELVAYLTDEEHGRLMGAMETRSLAAGDVVFRRGDAAESLALVEDGEIEVIDESLSEPLAVVGQGGVVGEVGFVDGRPRTHDVRARGACRLRSLGRQRFLSLAREDPQLFAKIAVALALVLTRRFRSVVRELEPVRAFSAALREPAGQESAEALGEAEAGFDEIDEPLPEGALEMLRAVAAGTRKGAAGL